MFRARLRSTSVLVFTASLAVHSGCLSGEPPSESGSRPVAEASGAEAEESRTSSDVPVDALSSLEKVYVPVNAASMHSLDDALADKGYGNVKSSDFKPRFETVTTEFGEAVTAYSSSDWIAPSSMFQPMSLTQWLEAALSYDGAEGVIINPGHPGQTLVLTKTEIVDALGWLPQREPLPMEIYVSQ